MSHAANRSDASPAVPAGGLLPDFCDSRVLLLLILVAEGLAIVLTLSQYWRFDSLWLHLGTTSAFIQTITLIDAALVCLLKRRLRSLPGPILFVSLYILLQLITAAVTWLVHLLIVQLEFVDTPMAGLAGQLIRNICISAIITGAMLRYFYVRHQSALQQRSESEARIQALQARIRPHFLFNSLNTIANLIHQQPDRAEEALLDLAELFRSTLGKQALISLDDELEIVRRYLRIEQLRLGSRLQVDWEIPQELNGIAVPALILQPLIENAIYHGIEPMPDGGHVRIAASQQQNCVRIEIHNPVAGTVAHRRARGNQLAVDNIRQRLTLAYGSDASLELNQNGNQYCVAVSIPLDVKYASAHR